MPLLFHQQSGEGFPLVFIHGFCESGSYWEGVHQEFASAFNVITIDLPGFGKSQLPDHSFSLEQVGDTIVNFLESKSIHQCMFIGHSLGGYVALEILRKHPDRTSAICLLNSSAFADPEDKKEIRNKLIEFIRQNGVKPFIKTFVPSLFYPGTSDKYQAVIEKIRDEGMSILPKSVIAYAAAMRDRHDSIDLLERYPRKVVLIAGEHDQNVPLETSLEMAARLDVGNSHIMPESAHMSWYEQHDLTCNAIKAFASNLANS